MELLAVAERAERAAGALRRAVTASGDIDTAVQDLLAAAAALTALHEPAPDEATPDTRARVTKPITEEAGQPTLVVPAAEPEDHPMPEADQLGKLVTKKVTKSRTRPPPVRATSPTPIDVDVDTVRLERSSDYNITGTWRVLAGTEDDPLVLGFLRREGIYRKWVARTVTAVKVSGHKPTRREALMALLLHHQQAAQGVGR
ncbi:hypothetical protein [Gandjariella thermophila]|uniref:hypothetical protein n=1 Tax=Gandjariella thermophila TaxID=1931992 RepID=UPI0018642346|nr:hypothetical protein [Gandjariella thermophila]